MQVHLLRILTIWFTLQGKVKRYPKDICLKNIYFKILWEKKVIDFSNKFFLYISYKNDITITTF